MENRGGGIALGLESGVELEWTVDLSSVEWVGRHFTGFECCLILRLDDGRFARLDLIWTPTYSQPLAASQHLVRIHSQIEDLGGYPTDPAIARAPQSTPHIEGHHFVAASPIAADRSYDFVGLWRANASRTTLLVAFDDDDAARHRTIAALAFDGAVVTTAGSHHGGPTHIRIASNPDAAGGVRLISLCWPQYASDHSSDDGCDGD